MADLEREKELAARHSLRFIQDGMVVGLGTGSTATFAIVMIGDLVRDGLALTGVPTSDRTAQLAREKGIPLVTLEDVDAIDVTIDGADEVLPNCDAIKGAGGALVREKIVASASRRVVLIVDSSKPVARLGGRPVPFEVVPLGWPFVRRQLMQIGFNAVLRTTPAGERFRTENGNLILDATLVGGAELPPDDDLRSIPGVVDHGVFRGIAHHVIIGRGETTEQVDRQDLHDRRRQDATL